VNLIGFTRVEYVRVLAGAETVEALCTTCAQEKVVDELTTVLPDFKRLQKLGVVSPSPAAWKMGFFKAVGGLRELRQVRLAYATFPEGALKFIGDLPNLEVLDLMQARQLSLKKSRAAPTLPETGGAESVRSGFGRFGAAGVAGFSGVEVTRGVQWETERGLESGAGGERNHAAEAWGAPGGAGFGVAAVDGVSGAGRWDGEGEVWLEAGGCCSLPLAPCGSRCAGAMSLGSIQATEGACENFHKFALLRRPQVLGWRHVHTCCLRFQSRRECDFHEARFRDQLDAEEFAVADADGAGVLRDRVDGDGASRFDISRFRRGGDAVSPRQSDVMIVAGTVTTRWRWR
jgi:hypothetical protein